MEITYNLSNLNELRNQLNFHANGAIFLIKSKILCQFNKFARKIIFNICLNFIKLYDVNIKTIRYFIIK